LSKRCQVSLSYKLEKEAGELIRDYEEQRKMSAWQSGAALRRED
jgi:hypothetical protein